LTPKYEEFYLADYETPREARAGLTPYKAFFGFGQLNDFQGHTPFFGGFGRCFARVTLVHIGQCHTVLGRFLHLGHQFGHLRSLLFIGRDDMHRQQMPEGVYRNVDFAAFFALGPIIARTGATFRRGLKCAPIKTPIKP